MMDGIPNDSDPAGVQPGNRSDAGSARRSYRLAVLRKAHLASLDVIAYGEALGLPEIAEAGCAAREACIRAEGDEGSCAPGEG